MATLFYIPIGLLSLFSLALILERTAQFLRFRNLPDLRMNKIMEDLRNGRFKTAFEEIKDHKSPVAEVFRKSLPLYLSNNGSLAIRMENTAQLWIHRLEGGMSFLSATANVSTLLGLLGTVTGMMRAFVDLQATGTPDPGVLAGGISQALGTTAAGLLVAIPSLGALAIFRKIVQNHQKSLEWLMTEILALPPHFRQTRQDPGAP